MVQDDDTEIVTAVAEEFVEKLGSDAVPYLRQEEDLAADRGDSFSADAWHDIADAATLILICGK
jgi:hypothetical protein